ncbi:MAG: hypothetical protein V3U11_14500, partial [Planctomycetota bacterium]
TPGPSAPSGPTTPTPSSASGGSGPTTGPRGSAIGDDLTKWQFWWEFNKDPFINLKDAIHRPEITTGSDDFFMGPSRRVASSDTAKPSKVDIMETILPALKRAIDNTGQRDITSSCIVAMAKIGEDHSKFKILPIFKKTLVSFDQEIRETAALAMGISQKTQAIAPLQHLVLDDAAGRKLVQKSFVDDRTRSFAAYGMGLIAHASDDVNVKRMTLETMAQILRNKNIVDRNIRVAAINAIGLLNPSHQNEADPNSILSKALAELDKFYSLKLGRGQELIQSHVPPAVAKLLGRGSEGRRTEYKDLYHKELTSGKKRSNDIYRAAAIALGQLAQPQETNNDDKKYSVALLDYFKKGKNPQARYFAAMSLGQIGGDSNKSHLLTILRKGKKTLEKPWAALALGVYCFNAFEKDPSANPDATVGEALLKQFREVRAPQARSAFAIAMGLARYRDAANDILELLLEEKHKDELAGYLSIGLALMDYIKAKSEIHEICRNSVRRPERLKQTAVALGKLGDRTVTDTLTEMLSQENNNLAKLSALAGALGFIGDRRTIKPLVKMLFNDKLGDLSRAFAAVALGGVADKEKLPWNSKIARNMNYRASVETLTGSGAGVLDIL